MLRHGLSSIRKLTQRLAGPVGIPKTAGLPAPLAHESRRWSWSRRTEYQYFGNRRPVLSLSNPNALRVLAGLGGGGLVVYVVAQQEVPYTERRHAILISQAAERELGRQTYRQVLEEARAEGSLVPSHHPATKRVQRVGSQIAAAVNRGQGGGFQEHMQGLEWQFAVIDSPQVNAFVVPGGKVVVYTGLLGLVSSDDELAAVLAHECAHVLARHAAERMTQGGVVSVIQMIAYWGFGIPLPSDLLVPAFFLPNSRKAETEADVIGIQLAAQACYDPAAAASVFQKLGAAEKKMGGTAMPKFLRTHPLSDERVARIKEELPKALGMYELAGCESLRGRAGGLFSGLGDGGWR
ncbi:hypothetical protein ACKKBG_A39385 [Auxenochlorella protothecoides x Auxenochlorella symbiontica]